ncbi:hypothetical protein PCANC_06229 [Puccinia coronata f. sp. avenae]|uniref:Uncharacterized protein n=1 Tax=Puccinia coronata f. sp. avenae TaxID=200324 RepID=A0A2N5V340_9BASI|nr:hypothetical protein PCANC_06229 [Puccinia coronata f. sp. avenae]
MDDKYAIAKRVRIKRASEVQPCSKTRTTGNENSATRLEIITWVASAQPQVYLSEVTQGSSLQQLSLLLSVAAEAGYTI